MGKRLFTLRLLVVHLLYILYSGILWTRLYMVAEERGFKKAGTITAAAVWSLVYVALNFFLIAAYLKSQYVNFSHLFVFMYYWFYMRWNLATKAFFKFIHTQQFALNSIFVMWILLNLKNHLHIVISNICCFYLRYFTMPKNE